MPRSNCFWDETASVKVGYVEFVENSKTPNVVPPGKSLRWSVKDTGGSAAKGVPEYFLKFANPLTKTGAKYVVMTTVLSSSLKVAPKVRLRDLSREVDA